VHQFRQSASAIAGSRSNEASQYTRSRTVPSGVIVRIVAGGSFRTPLTIVRGAGTTEWNVM